MHRSTDIPWPASGIGLRVEYAIPVCCGIEGGSPELVSILKHMQA